MTESDNAKQARSAVQADISVIVERLRRMKPSGWDLILDSLVACLGNGLFLLIACNSADRVRVPSFAIIPLLVGWTGLNRFGDHLLLRSRLKQLLRDSVGSDMYTTEP
ncbi:MAG: hypothetical protein ABSA67_08015 [Candidatus Brocadiia bacterium]|jgi:hypothetical protein